MTYIPQQNLDAERAVIGAIFIDNTSLLGIDLTPEDFYKSSHRTLFKGIQEVAKAGNPIDLISMKKHFGAENISFTELSEIISDTVTAANAKYHSALVKEASAARKLQEMCLTTLSDLSTENYETLDAIVAKINGALGDILQHRGGEITSMHEVAKDVIEYVERRRESRDSISGIPSGFKAIDKITDGFQPGDSIIVAGRPGMGKTAFGMGVAQNAAAQGYPIGFISLEMVGQQIGIRTLSSLSNIELYKLRKGYISRDDYALVLRAAARMAELPVYFSFTSWQLSDIQRDVTQMVHRHKVKMIIVDYLQLAKNSNQKQREREIGEISSTLKALAKSFNIPIMALSQLNRDPEKRPDRRPKISDLRDSGQIEQDADVIILLHREDVRQPKGTVEVIFSKGRNVGFGTIKLNFDGDKMQFTDAE